jgi:hypothetical protein
VTISKTIFDISISISLFLSRRLSFREGRIMTKVAVTNKSMVSRAGRAILIEIAGAECLFFSRSMQVHRLDKGIDRRGDRFSLAF